jgi:hypothetical protein
MCTYIYVLKFPIFCAIWLKKCDFLTQKLGIKKDPDPKLFIPDPDPDPSKSSGSGSGSTTPHSVVLRHKKNHRVTVGAQSIARRHSTYVITPKKPKFRKVLFGKIKKEEFARRFFKKNSVFSRLKLFNKHYSKMTFIFLSVFCQ